MSPQFVRLNLYPAQVTETKSGTESYVYPETRFVATDRSAYVFVDGRPTPTLQTEGQLVDFTEDQRGVWTMELDDGRTFTVTRNYTSCGCGSMLRGYDPFPGVPHETRARS